MGESDVMHIHQLLPSTCQEMESSGTHCKPLWSQKMATAIPGSGSWIPAIAWTVTFSCSEGVSCKDEWRETRKKNLSNVTFRVRKALQE